MSVTPKHDSRVRIATTCAAILLASMLHAENACPVEVKMLLSPTATQTAITSLQLQKAATEEVYFFDTPQLDLSSQGVIVRLRKGSGNDLTIKLRPIDAREIILRSGGSEDLKCEVDWIGGQPYPSYSIRTKYVTSPVPEDGNGILDLLTQAQRSLLKTARISIDWMRVTRIADIRSTDWEISPRMPFGKLTLELWETSAGNILELSTRGRPGSGPSIYTQLQHLAKSKKLLLGSKQCSKTSLVLAALTSSTASQVVCR